jgi:hypothetical protein
MKFRWSPPSPQNNFCLIFKKKIIAIIWLCPFRFVHKDDKYFNILDVLETHGDWHGEAQEDPWVTMDPLMDLALIKLWKNLILHYTKCQIF